MYEFLNECAFLLQKYGFSYLRGAGTTLLLALVGTLVGCLIGFAVGTVQTIPKADSPAGGAHFPAVLCGAVPRHPHDDPGGFHLLWPDAGL